MNARRPLKDGVVDFLKWLGLGGIADIRRRNILSARCRRVCLRDGYRVDADGSGGGVRSDRAIKDGLASGPNATQELSALRRHKRFER